jgi:sulfate adenylyltransferase subunit 1
LDSGAAKPADQLMCNDIGDVLLALDRPLICEPYTRSRDLGSFILIDRETYDTVALGLVTPPNSERGPSQSKIAIHRPSFRLSRFWKKIGLAAVTA